MAGDSGAGAGESGGGVRMAMDTWWLGSGGENGDLASVDWS